MENQPWKKRFPEFSRTAQDDTLKGLPEISKKRFPEFM
jgi:hypothetical protein